MRIKVAKGLYVDSNTLFRIEWRKFYPVLVLHEKYEKIIKWTLRIIAFIGIITSVISIEEWYYSLLLALLIVCVELFFEKTAFEYTTIILQPLPNFEIEYDQWVTNGFLIPHKKNNTDLAHFGPTYLDEKYAIKFFNYIKSWINDNSNDDTENTLIISLVIEPNESYTTYLYANPGRKRLNYLFKFLEATTNSEKHGKNQQKLVAQLFYWNTLDFKDGYSIKNFLSFKNDDEPFFFTPSVIQPFGLPPKFLTDFSIKKYHLSVRKREDVNNFEPEYLFDPAKFKDFASKKELKTNKHSVKDVYYDIQQAFNNAVDLGFKPNQSKNAGIINLCFDDCFVPFAAYEQLIKESENQEVVVSFEVNSDSLNLTLELKHINQKILLSNLKYNKSEFNKFMDVKGGGSHVIFVIGYPPANEKRIIITKETSPLVVKLKL